MSRFIVILALLVVIMPAAVYAKRGAPPKVAPIVYEDVRYIAPNDDGRRAYIQAWDTKTNKRLWELTVFKNHINPFMEEDVQHVYIKKMEIHEGKLILSAEDLHIYSLDLKTHEVKKLK